jgi:hypothetical protein
MAAKIKKPLSPSAERNRRIRERLFPQATALVFDNEKGGFVSLPIILRKLLKKLKPTELELLVYLWLRSDMWGLCYPTIDEIAAELGQQNTSRVRKTLRGLESKSLIITRSDKGRMYFVVVDPRHAIVTLQAQGHMTPDEVVEANELLGHLKQPAVPVKGPAP